MLFRSDGTKVVLNMAFICAIISLVNEKANEKDNSEDEKPQKYPLILDAPFSVVDKHHIKGICKSLSDNCEQIIISMMKKDYENSENFINEFVGKKYEIKKNSEFSSEICEVEV